MVQLSGEATACVRWEHTLHRLTAQQLAQSCLAPSQSVLLHPGGMSSVRAGVCDGNSVYACLLPLTLPSRKEMRAALAQHRTAAEWRAASLS